MSDVDLLNEAIALANAKDFEAAATKMNAVSPDSPQLQRPEVLSLHGVILWRGEKKLEEAQMKFQNALELNPEDAGAAQNLQQVTIQIKHERAKEANALRSAGDFEGACELYNSIDLDDPVSPELRFHVANNFGIVLKQLGRPHEALQAFETALEMDPSCLEAQFNRGVLLKESGQYESALDSFNEVLELSPGLPVALLGRLESMASLEFADMLLEECSDILEGEKLPGDFHPFYYRGYAQVLKEEFQPASIDLQQTMLMVDKASIDPAEYNKILETRQTAFGKLGEEQLLRDEFLESLESFDKALDGSLQPEDNGSFKVISFNKSLALLNLNRLEETMTLLRQIVAKYPDYWKAYEALGQLALGLENWQLAIDMLSVALNGDRLTPENADLLYNLGIAYYKIGLTHESDREKFVETITTARDTFQRVIDLVPDHEPAIKARDAMNELLRLKMANDPTGDIAQEEDPDFIPCAPEDRAGDKDGYTYEENGPKGAGYYRDFTPGGNSGENPGYVHLPEGPQGAGYYKMPEDARPYFIPGARDGEREGYHYRNGGHLGDGYYMNEDQMPGLRKNFKINRTGQQDFLIKKDSTLSSDPEVARLQKLGWSPDLIAMSLRLANKKAAVYEGQGAPVNSYAKTAAAASEPPPVFGRKPGSTFSGRPSGSALSVAAASSKYAAFSDFVCSYAQLKAPGPYPDQVNPAEREMYLGDEEFSKLIGMDKDKWASTPKWKKANVKKKLGLF